MGIRSFLVIFAIMTLGGALTYAFIYYGDLAPWAFQDSKDREPSSDGKDSSIGKNSGTPRVKPGSVNSSSTQKLVNIPGVGRMPASKADRLKNWKLELGIGSAGVKRITNMDYVEAQSANNPWDSSQQFLDEYSDYLFRVDRSQLTVKNMQDGSGEDELQKIVYEQNIEGIPVENSRLAFFYLPDGTLFEVQSSVAEAGDIPANRTPEISPLEAAEIASAAIAKRYGKAGLDLPPNFAPSVFAKRAEYRFFLSPSGVVTKRYNFGYVIKPTPGMDSGEYAIAVDTVTRTIASDRKTSKR